jgi:hypothetical protein
MFTFTKFVVADSVGRTTGMLLVSFSNKYALYNASRRRVMTDVMRAASGVDPVSLINNAQFDIWFHGSDYRRSSLHAIETLSYPDALLYANDRYDINQMMRGVLRPACASDGRIHPVDRRLINQRVEVIVDKYIIKQTGNPSAISPHARFKGGYYYLPSTLLAARNAFREFGHLVARAKAGDPSADSDALREAFYDLDNRYHDFDTHIGSAYAAIEDFDLGIVHCDCGHYESDENTHDVRNDTWCESCFDDDAVFCEDENEYWPRDDCYYSESRDAYYSYDRDGERDDDEDDDDRSQPIMSYSTNVLDIIGNESGIKSSHFGEFTMGIELEMTSGDNSSYEAAESVRSRLGSAYCIIKSDGSLPSNGFEVVTSPHGLTTHIEKFKAWDIDPAYRAWNTGKCGMHVHIDSRAFTQMTLGKFLMFINSSANVDFIRKIAGRHPSVDDQARSYCAAEHQSILVNPKTAVKGKSGERYRMVNMCNLGSREAMRLGLSMDNSYNGRYNTVELRIFRASLKKERLLAQIEFTHAAVMFCRVASWRDLNGTSFVKWLKTVAGQYPALVKWYGVRAVHGASKQPSAPAEVTCTDAVPPVATPQFRSPHGCDHEYRMEIAFEDGGGMRAYAHRHGLYVTYFRVIGLLLAVFPYSGNDQQIGDEDVIYVLDSDVWRLQDDDFNALVAGQSPVPADVNGTASV